MRPARKSESSHARRSSLTGHWKSAQKCEGCAPKQLRFRQDAVCLSSWMRHREQERHRHSYLVCLIVGGVLGLGNSLQGCALQHAHSRCHAPAPRLHDAQLRSAFLSPSALPPP